MSGRAVLPREVDATAFTAALENLLHTVPEALCATFVDAEGETIDLATRIEAFDAKIYAAEVAPLLARLRTAACELRVGSLSEARIVGERRAAVARHVADGCDVLVVIEGTAALARAAWACRVAAQALAAETGLGSRRSISSPPEAETGETPRAFLRDGRVVRIEAVIGAPDITEPEALLVRTPEGDEEIIVRDPATQRWYKR
jgi:predicted regulator of Ras-like GTPase activity (Roadblock/LC7/MglB family)